MSSHLRPVNAAIEPSAQPSSEERSSLYELNALSRRMIAICDQVGDAALRGAHPRELTAVFARIADKSVVLLDSTLRVIAQVGADGEETAQAWNPCDESARRLLAALEHDHRTLRVPPVPGSSLEHGCIATPITFGEATLGYLLAIDSDGRRQFDDVDLLITSYAATLFALTLAHERTSVDLGQRYRAVILDALVSGNFFDDHDAAQKAAILGLSSGNAYRVAVLRAHSAKEYRQRLALRPDVANELINLLVARGMEAVTIVRGSDVVIIVPASSVDDCADSQRQAAMALDVATQLIRQRSVPAVLTCGLSARMTSPAAAPRGLQQASDAIKLSARIGPAGRVVAFEELGVCRLLLQVRDMRQLWQFAHDVLGELIAYETNHSVDLIATLSVYLQEHASLKQAARRLQVHTNTITYRINRIEKLTGLRFIDPEDRLSAHVAIKIIESFRQAEIEEEAWGIDPVASIT